MAPTRPSRGWWLVSEPSRIHAGNVVRYLEDRQRMLRRQREAIKAVRGRASRIIKGLRRLRRLLRKVVAQEAMRERGLL